MGAGLGGGEASSGLAAGKPALLPLGSELHQSHGSWLNGSRLHVEASERKTKCNVERDETAVRARVRACVCACVCGKVQDSECESENRGENIWMQVRGLLQNKETLFGVFFFWHFLVELL